MGKISIPVKDEDIQDIAIVKKVMEYCSLVPGFSEKMKSDPRAALDELGIDRDEKEFMFNPNTWTTEGSVQMHPMYEGTAAEKYAQFMQLKVNSREQIKEICVPSNEAMKKWRSRQVQRCKVEMGAASGGFVHSPLVFELADGCSVGCEFCGLNAGRLKSVFRHTEENANLFREVLQISRDIIGYAAGSGTMYFATEPLDNPDYELFLEDYRDILTENPQITTARSTMHVDRLHKLLETVNREKGIIYRFSVLSLDMLYKIYEEFTPEELVLVELLPQFEEAPGNHFTKVGKNAFEKDEYDSTISCVSGFIVNMCKKTVRLSTPYLADKDHPTGEMILEEGSFTDAESYKDLINGMIKRHMSNLISPNDKLTLSDKIKYSTEEENILVINVKNEMLYKYKFSSTLDMIVSIFDLLNGNELTKRETVAKLRKDDRYKGISPESVHYIINRFWNMGYFKIVGEKI